MDERNIQMALYDHLLQKKHQYIVPNSTGVFGWEVDMLSCTKNEFLCEFEIKISKADFLADFKKIDKHRALRNRDPHCPTYFWYVVYGFMPEIGSLPEYAGLIQIQQYGNHSYVNIIKQAPRLHTNKIDQRQIKAIFTSVYYRFWDYRKQLNTIRNGNKQRQETKACEV